jgi:WD40 repeat protein
MYGIFRAATLIVACITSLEVAAREPSLKLEIQSPPSTSFQVAAHPSRPDLFANVEGPGETSLWQIGTNGSLVKLTTLRELTSAVALIDSPSDQKQTLIVVGTHYGELKIHDTTGNVVCQAKSQDDSDIVQVVPAGNSLLVTGGRSGNVDVWDTNCRLLKSGIFKHHTQSTGIVALPDKNLVILASYDGKLVAINMRTFAVVGSYSITQPGNSYEGGIRALAVSARGERLAVGIQSKIEMYLVPSILSALNESSTATPVSTLSVPDYLMGDTVRFIGDSILFADLYQIRFWSGGSSDNSVALAPGSWSAIAISSDERTVFSATGDDGPPKLWRFGYAQVGGPIKVANSRIQDIATLQDGSFGVVAEDGTMRELLSDGRVTREGIDLGSETFAFDLSPDAKSMVAGGGFQYLETIDLTTGAKTPQGFSLEFEDSHFGEGRWNIQFLHTKFLPDGRRFTAASSADSVGIWRLGSLAPEMEVQLDSNKTIMGLAVSQKGLIALAMGGDSGSDIVLLDSAGKILVKRASPHEGDLVLGVSFSPDGEKFLSYTRTEIKVWSAKDGAAIGEPISLPSDASSLIGARFARGDNSIVGAFSDGAVRVMDVGISGAAQIRYTSPGGALSSNDEVRLMEISPDRNMLITGSEQGKVFIWQIGLAPLAGFQKSEVATGVDPLFAEGLPPTLCGDVANTLKCWRLPGTVETVDEPAEFGTATSGALCGARGLLAASFPKGKIVISPLNNLTDRTVTDSRSVSGFIRWSEGCDRLFLVGAQTGELLLFEVPDDIRMVHEVKNDLGREILALFPISSGGVIVVKGDTLSVTNERLTVTDSFTIPASCPRYFRYYPIVVSDDARTIAMACDDGLLIMTKASQGWQPIYRSTWTPPISMALSSDQTMLITAHSAGFVQVWSLATGKEVRQLRVGLPITHVGLTGSVITAASSGGTLEYFDATTGEFLGRTVLSSGGEVTISAEGHFTQSGAAWPLQGFQAGVLLDQEIVSRLWSSTRIHRDLFTRDSVLASLLAYVSDVWDEIVEYYGQLPLYERVLWVLGVAYGTFAVCIFALWLIKPGQLCSWALRLGNTEGLSLVATAS